MQGSMLIKKQCPWNRTGPITVTFKHRVPVGSHSNRACLILVGLSTE